jgi:hypothetical protein
MMRSFIILAALGACTDGQTDHAGIYAVDSWTFNEAGCDAEGPPLGPRVDRIDTPSAFVAVINEDGGFEGPWINVELCESEDECRTDASDGVFHASGWSFEEGEDGPGWTRERAYGSDIDGRCDALLIQTRMTFANTGVVIEERRTSTGFERDANGECSDAAAATAARAQRCNTLEVTSASFAGSF